MRDLDQLLREFRRQGLQTARTGKGHWQIRTAAGRLLGTAAGTSASTRALANLKSDVARRLREGAS